MISTVIFDMDGVLIDSEPIHQRVNQSFFSRIGTEVGSEFYNSNFVGLPVEQMMVYLKEKHNLKAGVPELMAECGALLYKEFEQSELVPVSGVKELLGLFREEQFNLAVGSSSSPELIRLIIGKLGLDHFFHHLVSGYEVKKGKPEPDLFLKIAGIFNESPENCAVIEDSALGLKAASLAGMPSIGVRNPSSGDQDLSLAELIVPGFGKEERGEILKALQSW